MKKILYTILSICAIVYIVFLSLNIFITKGLWTPSWGGFQKWFDIIVNFGGVAIIFAFALVNFAGSPLKVAFFIALIVAIILYIVVLSAPEPLFKLFGGKKAEAEFLMSLF